MTWEIFWIIIAISIIIFITKKWGENIKKIFKTSRLTKISAQTSNSTPNAGNTTPPPAGHAHTSAKPQTGWFSKIFWTITTVILIIAALVFTVWAFSFVRSEVKPFLKPSRKTETVKPPDVIIETYPLNKDSKKIRVYTHDGYNYERYSDGWKYYCTPQNGVKTLRGDGDSKKDGTVRYFDLEFYEVECVITVIFTKK